MTTLERLLVHPVRLLRPATLLTPYGDTIADWSLPPLAAVDEKGWFTRVSTDESGDGREAITDLFELTLGPDSAITESMRVEFAGDTYEIRGSVDRARTPDGVHHVVARLRRVEG